MKVKGACLKPILPKRKEARMLLLIEQHMNGKQVIRAKTGHETSASLVSRTPSSSQTHLQNCPPPNM